MKRFSLIFAVIFASFGAIANVCSVKSSKYDQIIQLRNNILPIEISGQSFLEKIDVLTSDETKRTYIFIFSAPWCSFCKGFEQELSRDLPTLGTPNLEIYKVNYDLNKKLAATLGVQVLPTTFVYREGINIDIFSGKPDDTLNWLNKLISEQN